MIPALPSVLKCLPNFGISQKLCISLLCASALSLRKEWDTEHHPRAFGLLRGVVAIGGKINRSQSTVVTGQDTTPGEMLCP